MYTYDNFNPPLKSIWKMVLSKKISHFLFLTRNNIIQVEITQNLYNNNVK